MDKEDKIILTLGAIAVISVVVLVVAFAATLPNHKARNDAKAKCESMSGTFSYPSLTCFVDGTEVAK